MFIPDSMRILYNTSLLTEYRLSWSLWIVDIRSHCTSIFSPVSDGCRKSDQ
jgi:hypothetical protein